MRACVAWGCAGVVEAGLVWVAGGVVGLVGVVVVLGVEVAGVEWDDEDVDDGRDDAPPLAPPPPPPREPPPLPIMNYDTKVIFCVDSNNNNQIKIV